MWPAVARAQQGEQVRRLGVLLGWDDNDTLAEAWFSGFTQGMSELGWTDGRNLRMDVRWAAGNIGRMRMYAKELVGLGPEVILASSTPVTAALQRETQTIPIVLRASPTRLAPVSWRAWRARVEISPASST